MRKAAIKAIKFYRNYLSALKLPSCKFSPTCSQYAIDAIERKGIFVGCTMAVKRIFRCNPFSKGGHDPVK